MSAKKQHPELQDGEVFIGNDTTEGYAQTDWKTKRKGKQAYDFHGKPLAVINGLFPVFAQKSELDEAGVTIGS